MMAANRARAVPHGVGDIMDQDTSVAELLERAVAGEDAALDRLLLRQHPRLAGMLARKLPDHLRSVIAVEDVLQETYVVVFREIRAFRPQSAPAFEHWLSCVAEHRLYDAIRAEHAAKRGGDWRQVASQRPAASGTVVDWLEQVALHERTPSQSAAAREAVGIVRAALEGLPEHYSQALRLRYLEGLTVAQTAERMKRTEGAVCVLCHRALKRLHTALGSSTEFLGLRE
ncbi:MAG: sigma-70 family RNA polymerase sigma factor [Phycisphaerales bacterium]|nr:sigma-70 family RNA polymerase sigma factor [Phycisphaerales bacterium]